MRAEGTTHLNERNFLGVVGVKALEDALKDIARPVLLSDHLRQPEQHAHALVGPACLDHLNAAQHAVAVGVDPSKRLRDLTGGGKRLTGGAASQSAVNSCGRWCSQFAHAHGW